MTLIQTRDQSLEGILRFPSASSPLLFSSTLRRLRLLAQAREIVLGDILARAAHVDSDYRHLHLPPPIGDTLMLDTRILRVSLCDPLPVFFKRQPNGARTSTHDYLIRKRERSITRLSFDRSVVSDTILNMMNYSRLDVNVWARSVRLEG